MKNLMRIMKCPCWHKKKEERGKRGEKDSMEA